MNSDDFSITFAPQDRIYLHPEKVDAILKAIGISSAWLSDQSALADFCLSDQDCVDVSVALGVSVSKHDLLVDVVDRMVALDTGNTGRAQ